jgi:hypothetical protein
MKPWIVFTALVAIVAAAVVIGKIEGDGDWGPPREERVITTPSGDTVVIEDERWRGFPFGILLLPLIILGLVWAFGGRRGRGWDPGDRAQWLSDWHRAEHERMARATGPDRPAVPE